MMPETTPTIMTHDSLAENAAFERPGMNERHAIAGIVVVDECKRERILWLLTRLIVALIGLGAIAVLTPGVARVYPVSSDDATGVLEADAILHGNVLLRGWTLSNISFTTTDLPFYIAGVALAGMRPSLLRDVPVAVYIASVS